MEGRREAWPGSQAGQLQPDLPCFMASLSGSLSLNPTPWLHQTRS